MVTEKEIVKMFRALKLPTGKGASAGPWGYSWSKDGGYCDAIMRRVEHELVVHSFSNLSSSENNSPDGNVIGHGRVWKNPVGWTVEICNSYGVLADNNYFSIRLTPPVVVSTPEPNAKDLEYINSVNNDLVGASVEKVLETLSLHKIVGAEFVERHDELGEDGREVRSYWEIPSIFTIIVYVGGSWDLATNDGLFIEENGDGTQELAETVEAAKTWMTWMTKTSSK